MESKKPKTDFSLKVNCQSRLKALFSEVSQTNQGCSSFILVMDKQSIKVVSSSLKMMELMELNILAVEQIENERQEYPKQHAIYFLSPTHESVTLLAQDFPDQKNFMYGAVHVFFSNKITTGLMEIISSSAFLMQRIVSFKEFNQDFSSKFDNLFSLDMADSLPTLFSDNSQQHDELIEVIAAQLSTVVSSLDQFHAVEIAYNKAENQISQKIAEKVYDRLNELVVGLQQDQSDVLDSSSGKVTLLIIDRSYDPLTPLLRDFFYQPMLYDLLEVQNDIVEYQFEDQKGNQNQQKTILSDGDDLFAQYRFQHIAETMEGIPSEFKVFVDNNAAAQVQKGQMNNLDLSKMSEIVKMMPQYQELLGQYTMHMQLIDECWKLFEAKDLADLGQLEQTLATGLDQQGQNLSMSKIMTVIGSKLESPKLSALDKLRLVLITTISFEMGEKDRQAITGSLPIEHQKAIQNLIWLGINPQKSSDTQKSKPKQRIDEKTTKTAKNKMSTSTLNLCRTTPAVELLIEQSMEEAKSGNLKFPQRFRSLQINCGDDDGGYSKPKVESLRKQNKLVNIIGVGDDETDTTHQKPKIILFIAGGISFSEIRSIRNLMDTTEILPILGGTTFLRPNDYINGLMQMNDLPDY